MAKSKAVPKCGLPKGHAAAADQRVERIHAEIKRVGEQYARLLVDRGPRCQHSPEGADARNVRLMEQHAQVVKGLTERIRTLEAELAGTRTVGRAQGTGRPKGSGRKGGQAQGAPASAPLPVLPY